MTSENLTWPLIHNVIRRRSTSNTFGLVRTNANGTKRAHQGWDFEARVGTPIYAISDGIVADHGLPLSSDHGIAIMIQFQFAEQVRYAFYSHLQEIASGLKVGSNVKMGQYLGRSGKTGNASKLTDIADEHLHFEIRLKPKLGKGLTDRESPIKIFQQCPLRTTVVSP